VNIVANIKSAKKRILVIAKKTALNKARKTSMKTATRRFLEAVETGDKALATEKLRAAEKLFRRYATKGTIHRNAASRKVSRLYSKLNQMA
jgi:small subunit ribosomal protein S20